ncbi:MAG: sporulation protein YtfJ [Ruminococcaceae bacterium]|nr:sporulation protein YtfJ [Oscillospiraceae bacterium]
MASENKLQEVVQSTLAQIRNMIDANTVIGTPVETKSGTTIIPISKVALGFATGGLDYNDKNGGAQGKPQNFGAGGGTGITVQPIGMLCVDKEGNVELINIGVKNPTDPMEQLSDIIDRSPEIIARIKALFAKDKKEDEQEEEDAE